MKRVKKIAKNSWKEIRFIVPVFFVATLVSVLVERYVPDQIISELIGDNLFFAIPLAAALGVILPIPRYATYPLAAVLFLKGAGYGVVFALISGEVIFESFVRDVVEIRYFGLKFFSARMIVSTVFIIAGAFAMEAIL